MNNYAEKRKYKRIELQKWKYKEIVSPCIARFRIKQCDGQETLSLEWNIVAVKNLSAGGIMFNYYKESLEIGSLIDLKIEFIKSKPTINCIGRVVRFEDTYANSMFRIATEFVEIDDKEREIINTTVEAILGREAKGNVLKKIKEMKNAMIKMVMYRGRSANINLGGILCTILAAIRDIPFHFLKKLKIICHE